MHGEHRSSARIDNGRSSSVARKGVRPLGYEMKVLIIGAGGREHALAWKIAQSPRVGQIFVAPGNAGTRLEPNTTNVDIAADDVRGLLAFAQRERIDLTIVGPEGPLVLGICDQFAAAGLRCFGPSRTAARLEGSKAYAKDFLRRHGIPTAAYATFTRETFDPSWIRGQAAPLVVKADGLAAGKGVVICATVDEAVATAQDMFSGRFGKAGDTVVVEQFLEGEEASFIAMVDGQTVLPLATSQDHKRLGDGDVGPNTGGMGAYSPAPVVTPEVHERIMREVMLPTVAALASEGTRYLGFLYAGVMIDATGTPRVLEFNCRFGDPETQPILARMRSDLTSLCEAALDGRLAGVEVDWDPRAAVGVVMAASGYPDTVRTGDEIHGLDAAARMPGKVFHAGTTLSPDGKIVTSGGRVLCAVGLGTSVRAAQKQAYELVGTICWQGLQFRKDIGFRAIARE
jgi:phosphoribosylamine--glycine ligase